MYTREPVCTVSVWKNACMHVRIREIAVCMYYVSIKLERIHLSFKIHPLGLDEWDHTYKPSPFALQDWTKEIMLTLHII